MTTNALALPGIDLPSANEWQTMTQMAQAAFRSQLLPAHIKTEQAALFIVMKARELNIPATYGLSNIAVIEGKPTANAELMAALIYRAHGDNALEIAETSNNRCHILYRRRHWTHSREYTFTREDAETAGLWSKPTWQKYPAAMLRARCISAVGRLAFPDVIAGMYTPEELGAPVKMSQEGAIVIDEDNLPPEPITARVAPPVQRDEPPAEKPPKATKYQLQQLWATANECGWDEQDLRAHLRMQFPDAKGLDGNPSTRELTASAVNMVIAFMESHPVYAVVPPDDDAGPASTVTPADVAAFEAQERAFAGKLADPRA